MEENPDEKILNKTVGDQDGVQENGLIVDDNLVNNVEEEAEVEKDINENVSDPPEAMECDAGENPAPIADPSNPETEESNKANLDDSEIQQEPIPMEDAVSNENAPEECPNPEENEKVQESEPDGLNIEENADSLVTEKDVQNSETTEKQVELESAPESETLLPDKEVENSEEQNPLQTSEHEETEKSDAEQSFQAMDIDSKSDTETGMDTDEKSAANAIEEKILADAVDSDSDVQILNPDDEDLDAFIPTRSVGEGKSKNNPEAPPELEVVNDPSVKICRVCKWVISKNSCGFILLDFCYNFVFLVD